MNDLTIPIIVVIVILLALYRYRNHDSVEIDGHTYHIDGSGNGRP